jgi:MoaA/NifB/PqqE/SkfB family radical SAM enzyme
MAVGWLVFDLTNRCQLGCGHCLRDPAAEHRDLDPELLDRIVEQAVDVYNTRHVGFTGGEPTLHPRFWQIVDGVVARGLSWHVVTNGQRFAARILEPLLSEERRRQALTVLNFSLDGVDEPTNDRIRGEGSFRELMHAINHCRHHRLPFLLQMTVHRQNVDQIERMALLAADLGADRLAFSMSQPSGTAFDSEMHLPLASWRKARARIEKLSASQRIPILCTDSFPQRDRFYLCSAFTSDVLHIDHRGYLSICCQHADIAGEDSPADAIADLREVALVEAHRRLLALVFEQQQARLAALRDKLLDPWDDSPCNYCMKHFGKPYWSDEGAQGPQARQERRRRDGGTHG